MPDPLDTNDDWAELARELDRDRPPVPSPADRVERANEAESGEPHPGDSQADDEAADGESDGSADEEFDDADNAPGGEATAEGEQPGTGRKRRRRRRRRRKGGPAAETATPLSGDGENAAEEEPVAEPVAEMESDDFGPSDVVEVESDPIPFTAEEDTASEVLRDLIANWNVPAWDDIVGGLYRPN